jgi:hypothetical protein
MDFAVGCPGCGRANHDDEFTCVMDDYSQKTCEPDFDMDYETYKMLCYKTKSKFWGRVEWPLDDLGV